MTTRLVIAPFCVPVGLDRAVIADPMPSEGTARRLEWRFLPPHLRDAVERVCGPVASAESRTQGFTPGFASVLTCADGSRHFVKAASVAAQRAVAASYRNEARWLAQLPHQVPAPRLSWHDEDDWVVLAIEHDDGRIPGRPWSPDDLDLCLEALRLVAEQPAPDGLGRFSDDYAEVQNWLGWAGDLIGDRRLPELSRLLVAMPEHTAGSSLVHSEVRADNLLISGGTARICDWSWPTLGAGWIDTVMLLTAAHGDGIDTDAVLGAHALTADVDPEAVDALLALQLTWYARSSALPVPHNSPHVRDHQRWHAQAAATWLSARRGW